MSLLASLLEDITVQGRKVEDFLGNDSPSLYETGAWKYDDELLPREAWEASQMLMADCQQLIALLMPRKLKLMYESISNNAAVALEVACDLKVADKIAENGGEITLAQLAKACDTNEHKLGCTMRVLTHRHLFWEAAPDVFRNNRHSFELISGNGARECCLLETQEAYQVGPSWLKTMRDPKRMNSIEAKDGAFADVFGRGVLEYIFTPEGATCMTNMTVGVPWMSTITVAATRSDLPWDSYGSTICDVGAGLGSVMLEVKKTFPSLNTFKGYEQEMANGEIKLEVHDYFTPQETVADAYWFRGVIREYEDEVAAKVLANLKPALKKNPKARVFVNELFIPRLVVAQDKVNAAASQHTSRQQSGWPIVTQMQQLGGQQLFSGKERTFEEIKNIGEMAGLRFVKYHRFRMFTGAAEFELPSTPKL
ncbi:hypothetical protein LTR10_016074 [Elasticomyces elasticus]|uniref:O-methyltransferase domain-containing protein n=1 Tax=Exophiala sideris TaxID=1016849 RepID=A0ABR0J1Y0_9EURO|nr:hypothetical protein LTR10_016074 [Elasticomyces elasticus]KAK5024589.1 hypothetical protein LTS07_008435 [Exophiala sideris]KAK5030683.1 hypothetical protein LTR13_008037 [Exophiala sideris]KAK5054222.1 hypothetical protein LTR69_008837 [Exophiala sideris]